MESRIEPIHGLYLNEGQFGAKAEHKQIEPIHGLYLNDIPAL